MKQCLVDIAIGAACLAACAAGVFLRERIGWEGIGVGLLMIAWLGVVGRMVRKLFTGEL